MNKSKLSSLVFIFVVICLDSTLCFRFGKLIRKHIQNVLSSSSQPSVWTVFGDLASKTGASNLGQGFPDWSPPPFVLDALQATLLTPNHQYTRPAGHPPLVRLLASAYSSHLNRHVDSMNEVCITVGASQALYLSLISLLKPDDEVVIFEPYFDLYLKQLKLMPGVKTKFVPLGAGAATDEDPWALDIDALKSAINEKTRILILNSPHNPTGKVFTLHEMEQIADVVRQYPRLVVLSDEVYKFSIYDPLEEGDSFAKGHYHFARLPGMWDRTITLSSCGKTFSVTGWQVGWMIGPAKYIIPVQDIIPCVQFCASTPIQSALTIALPTAQQQYLGYSSYYEWLRLQFQTKRKILEKGLKLIGVEPLPSRGGFFLLAKLPTHFEELFRKESSTSVNGVLDEYINSLLISGGGIVSDDVGSVSTADGLGFTGISDRSLSSSTTGIRKSITAGSPYTGDLYLPRPYTAKEPYDWKYCRMLATTAGVVGIPASPFFNPDSTNGRILGPMARFAFCKKDKTIENAYKKLNLARHVMLPSAATEQGSRV